MSEKMPVIWRWIAAMPSTNVRISVSLILSFGTGMRVIWAGWAPPGEWLMFLAGMAAIDTGQFIGKRVTQTKPAVTVPEVGT